MPDATDSSSPTDSSGDSADGGEDGEPTGEPGEPGEPVEVAGPTGLRRLTRTEYDNALRDLLGDVTRPGSQSLPEDPFTPFDNDYGAQEASQPLIEGLEVLARDAAQRLMEDPTRRDEVIGCIPRAVSDEACVHEFTGRFGRLALRRPLRVEERDALVALGLEYATREQSFYAGIAVILRALLQDAEFIYRVELGTAVDDQPGVYALNDFEIATRMSFLLWGSIPDDALLDAAEAGELRDPQARAEVARAMLGDPRARTQIDRFHAMWLGFAQLPHAPELTNALRQETSILVQRVIFEDIAPWIELFTAQETFISASLAEHYGLPAPTYDAGSWVDYGGSGRQGILSHGSFLSAAAGPGETSPTRRGQWIREQLMCQPIPPPPPTIDADNPPSGEIGECKEDRYRVHAEVGSCAGCHAQMDPIGFGLEQYDTQGRFRTHEDGAPQCTIAGDGALVEFGDFNGPAELSELLVTHRVLQPCVARQLMRFVLGRDVTPDDMPWVSELSAELIEGDGQFDSMLATLVSHPAFAHRTQD